MAEEILYLTEEGLEKLQQRYHDLVHVEREKNKQELAEARSLGDLSENADYDAARERQAEIENEIAKLEYQLTPGHYEIIKAGKSKTVTIGSTVKMQFLDTMEEAEYQILGSTEADPLNGVISNETPLARAILDHKVGDEVEVNVKAPYKVKIVKISTSSKKNA